MQPNRSATDVDPTSRFWAHATAFGAAWGVFELTLGTFLHTLRIPFAGTLLACAGAALLVAERQVMPARGLTLATGLVAAACKSVSPGGVIFGPMAGIAMEALLVEAALLVAPRAWASAMLAGAAAALWPLAQGLLVQLLLYGGTILELYAEALGRLAGAVRLSGAEAGGVAAILLAALAAAGALAGVAGRVAGTRALATLSGGAGARPPRLDLAQIAAAPTSIVPVWLPPRIGRHRDLVLALVAGAAVVLQLDGGLFTSLASLAALLTALALLRPEAARKLARPRFWIISLVLAAGCGLLLGPPDLTIGGSAPIASSAGARAGLLMVVRGALVFSLTAWLAVALPASRLMRRAGTAAGPVGRAVQGALGLLPHLQRVLEKAPSTGGRPPVWDRAVGLVMEAARLADSATRPGRGPAPARPLVAALIGPRRSGKTRSAGHVARGLAARGIATAGVCQPARDGRAVYDLVDLSTGACRVLARRRDTLAPIGERASEGIGYDIDAETLAWGAELIAQAAARSAVLIVDEVGRLEAQGRGHWPAIARALGRDACPAVVVLAVQAAAAAHVEARAGGFWRVLRLPASGDEIERLVAEVARAVEAEEAGAPRAHPSLPGVVIP